jgi:ABC-type multidrug transport system ATPase subunit
VGVKLKHSIVGGASKKGISGGQKKRVSIAMEMMKEASMFFLDG